MTNNELILIYSNRIAVLNQVKQDAINMGDIDRVRKTIADIEQAEQELAKLQAE